MEKKKRRARPISLKNIIDVKKLCKGGYCISKELQDSPKEYLLMLRHAIRNLNEGEFYGGFIFLISTLESLEKEGNLHIPHKPSYREQADRYYKILRECKREQIPGATESTRIDV